MFHTARMPSTSRVATMTDRRFFLKVCCTFSAFSAGKCNGCRFRGSAVTPRDKSSWTLSDARRPAAPRPWITKELIRAKNPAADLKAGHTEALAVSFVGSFILHASLAVTFPTFESTYVPSVPPPLVITLEDIPETTQKRRAAFEKRPELPLGATGVAVPEVEAEKNTLLDSLAKLDLLPKLSDLDMSLDEETVGFWAVSKEPRLISEIVPDYTKLARDAGLEGVVFVKFAVGSNGFVKRAYVLRGPKIFRQAAFDAVSSFEFIPAYQNDKAVAVWMTLPTRFRLVDSEIEVGQAVQPATGL